MRSPARLQVLSFLIFYICQTNGIMVKFGTNQGPITPEINMAPVPPPKTRVTRMPAPVWESRVNDAPDPNAHWRPKLFQPQTGAYQPLFTKIVHQKETNPPSSAKDFVNAYKQIKPYLPVQGEPITNYFTPEFIVSQLGTKNIPGIGLRYFVPMYVQVVKIDEPKSNDDSKLEELETNEIEPMNQRSESKLVYKKRPARENLNTAFPGYIYQFPAYVPPKHNMY